MLISLKVPQTYNISIINIIKYIQLRENTVHYMNDIIIIIIIIIITIIIIN